MSVQTPRRPYMRGPSIGNHNLSAASSPNLAASYQRPPMPSPLSASAIMARKASFNQLTGSAASVPDNSDGYRSRESQRSTRGTPKTPTARGVTATGDGDIEVGDTVNVPGGMYGTVKFIGAVKGKNGVFAGVELSREWAARGKNDGDVDGTRYFTTSVRGAGIFLPVSRATKRASPTGSTGSFPPTPTTPSLVDLSQATPSVPKFSQSVGPGRGPSPQFKPKSRLSLPRPESPLRHQQNLLPTPRQPSLSASVSSNSGMRGPRYAPSPSPSKFGSSVRGRRDSNNSADPSKRPTLGPVKAGSRARAVMSPPPGPQASSRSISRASRSTSRQSEGFAFDDDVDGTPIGLARTNDSAARSISALSNRLARTSSHTVDELERMKVKLEERDRQLKEQSSTLADMESSLIELQALLPTQDLDMMIGSSASARDKDHELKDGDINADADVAQLRALLREKNEKLAFITAEFDAHRADFRSTIDTLELASVETERVYEKRVEELLREVHDLNERNEDVESVARQLKQLEELVQELEEGLEDARRGEAEARGEVEFLRGEVERGRSELRREREKAAAAAAAAKNAANTSSSSASTAVDGRISVRDSKEVEQKDDEIRGLKAIIHSLSRDSVIATGPAAATTEAQSPQQQREDADYDRREQLRLREELEQERAARDQLEQELAELRRLVEHKAHQDDLVPAEQEHNDHEPVPESAAASSPPLHDQIEHLGHEEQTYSPKDDLWCEICETEGHDILTCTNVFAAGAGASNAGGRGERANSQPGFPSTGNAEGNHTQRTPRNGMAAVVQGLRGMNVSDDYSTPHPPQHPPRSSSLGESQSQPQSRVPSHSQYQAQASHSHTHDLAHDTPANPPLDTPHHDSDIVAPLSTSPIKRRNNPTWSSTGETAGREIPAGPAPAVDHAGMVAGKTSGVINPDKWCALCERDGHESVDCPLDDAFA